MTEWEELSFLDGIWELLPTFNTDDEPLPVSKERRDELVKGVINQLTDLVNKVLDEKIKAAQMDWEFNQQED